MKNIKRTKEIRFVNRARVLSIPINFIVIYLRIKEAPRRLKVAL